MTEEEFHVTLDFRDESPDFSQPYKLIGLESEHPIIQVGHQVYQGAWATMVGTEMIFDDEGDWIMNVQKRLVMSPVEVKRKVNGQSQTAKTKLIRLEDVQEAAIAPISVLEPGTSADEVSAVPSSNVRDRTDNTEMDVG